MGVSLLRDHRGRWYLRLYSGRKQGKQTLGDVTEAEARAALEQVRAELAVEAERRHHAGLVFADGQPIPLDRALERHAARHKHKRGTRKTYRSAAQRLVRYFGHKDLRALRRDHLRAFADACFAEGLADTTVQQTVSLLRLVLNDLVLDETVPGLRENPIPRPMLEVAAQARAHPGRRRPREREAWSPAEAWALLDLARACEPAWHPVFLFLHQTGCRVGEALGLRWDAVNGVDRVVEIRRAIADGEDGPPKWGKRRRVPISEVLEPELRERARARGPGGAGLVFGRPGGGPGPIPYSTLRGAWRRVARAGERAQAARPFPLHAFRHTWATSMLRAGEDPQWVAQVLGDSLEVVYAHYSHAMPRHRPDLEGLRRPARAPGQLVGERDE
jgi:integrase